MGNVLIGIVGVVIVVGLALAGALFLGDRFKEASNDAEAARYIAEGKQISHAYELYGLQEGDYPQGENSDEKMAQLINGGYLKSNPLGGGRAQPGNSSAWYIDDATGSALTFIGEDQTARNICVQARIQSNMPDPQNIKQCAANDLLTNDPCCIGA